MGLMVHSLEGIPEEHHRDYFIYLLDYGWDEPLGEALKKNFGKMATLASQKKNAVVIMRTDEGIHFNDEVLSWHSINGQNVEEQKLLPAILITNKHPAEFRKESLKNNNTTGGSDFKMILIPLRKLCQTTTDVVALIENIFSDIKNEKDLKDFKVAKELKKGVSGALADSVILEPNFYGIGFSFNKFKNYFKNK